MEAPAESADRVSSPEVGFAPRDLTDRRRPGEWKSRYPRGAWKWIFVEAGYLALLLAAVVFAFVQVWLRHPGTWWNLSSSESETFTRYAYAWLAGTLGGLLFAMKWLYHSVAKEMWHLDRAPWRYLTPHISGGLAFATVTIFNSIIANDPGSAMPATKIVSIGFLVGFFSDNALAKLAEVADTLLGQTRRFPAPKQHDSTDASRS